MPGATYDIKLTADLNHISGQFEPATDRSRKWAKRDAGSMNWRDLPIDPNIRGAGPALTFNTSDISDADTAQITVYFSNGSIGANWSGLSLLTISAIFTPADHATLPVASPFRNANGQVQTVISGSWTPAGANGIYQHPDLGPNQYAAVLPLGPFSIDPSIVSPNHRKWRFEFTVVAHFEFGTSVCEYAYDPEMEVDVGTGTVPGQKALSESATA